MATLSDAEHTGHTTEVCICCIAREAFLVAVVIVILVLIIILSLGNKVVKSSSLARNPKRVMDVIYRMLLQLQC